MGWDQNDRRRHGECQQALMEGCQLSTRPMSRMSETVSFESEALVLVDEHDRALGQRSKTECHDGEGVLHRAFSLFIFNDAGELLLQRRSSQKRLWPLYWSNSCCSHPRVGETMEDAIHRRLYQELGVTSELRYLFKFRYHARFADAGAEHEFCWVYIGTTTDRVTVNSNEIAEWRFIAPAALDREVAAEPGAFTPWFRDEWERIRRDHRAELRALGMDGEPRENL